jgi:MOSC domain-containing protein YiiM
LRRRCPPGGNGLGGGFVRLGDLGENITTRGLDVDAFRDVIAESGTRN